MTTGVGGEAPAGPSHATGGPPAARPPELAQVVWRRAVALVDPGTPHDQLGVAIDLLRLARHDPGVIAHASTLGRTHLRAHPDDRRARAAAELVHTAITILGVKPREGDVATPATSEPVMPGVGAEPS